jgi:hypothetical protein
LNVFKRLTQMRKAKKVLQGGNLESLADGNLLILKREIPGTQLFAVLNLGTADQGIRLSDYFGSYKSLVTASVVSSNSGIRRG